MDLICSYDVDRAEGTGRRLLGCVRRQEGVESQSVESEDRSKFKSKYGDCNKVNTPAREKNLDFITNQWLDGLALSAQADVPTTWILSWAALESAWGTSAIARNTNNYFGLTKGSWPGEVDCPVGTSSAGQGGRQFACFTYSNSIYTSGGAALFGQRPSPGTPAQVLSNADASGTPLASAFQSMNDYFRHDPGNTNYGNQVAGVNSAMTPMLDCLFKQEIITVGYIPK